MINGSMERIRAAFDRSRRALALRPALGRKTALTQVRVTDGLECHIEEGPWVIRTDMSEKAGGTGLHANPGILGRGALGACFAVGIMQWAALRGVVLTAVEVDVEADMDLRGDYGVGLVPPGYLEIRLAVRVESPEDPALVESVVAEAEETSAWLAVFRQPQRVKRSLEVRGASRIPVQVMGPASAWPAPAGV